MKKGITKNSRLIIEIALFLTFIIGGTYAWLTLSLNGTKNNVLRSGTLQLTLDDTTSSGINLENTVPMSDTKGLTTTAYTFTLKNSGSVSSDYTIYLDDLDLDTNLIRMNDKYVKYSLKRNIEETTTALLTTTGTNPNRILDIGTIEANTTNTYTLRIWIDSEAGNEVMGTVFSTQLRVDAAQSTEKTVVSNENIKAVYTYDDVNLATKCITGEEETCQESTCYDDRTTGTCTQGTIVKYAVNDTTDKYFYVLHDDGATLTLQQRENTIRNIAWYSLANDNTKGPLTILPQLEDATKSWTNVNDQSYAMGTTNFNNTNFYTGCGNYNSCTKNTYMLENRTAKARMITIQEAMTTGCTTVSKSCPKWMYNYLYQSTSYGGTVDDNTTVSDNYNYGYRTMSANTSNSTHSWLVYHSGYSGRSSTTNITYGARAVVVINK